MVVYNYLFYHVYELALRSRSNRDMPMFATIGIISLVFMFNVFAISFLIEGMSGNKLVNFSKESRYIGSIAFLLLVSFYYLYKNRYKNIYSNYVRKRSKKPSISYCLMIVFVYYAISFGILLISAMFKNQDGIFG